MDLSEVLASQLSTSFDNLPNELVMDILSRLPVKTIVQSTCVCKKWYSIIKSPALVSAHLSHSISDPFNHYILFSSSKTSDALGVFTLHLVSDNKFLSHYANLKIPFETRSKSVSFVASCHGLVCLTDPRYEEHYGRDIYLLNPSIQKYRKLSAEFSCYSDLLYQVEDNIVIGFGYSERQNDYKVLRIIYAGDHISGSKAEVYSLKSGNWKIIDAPDVPILVKMILADGCLYWLPSSSYGTDSEWYHLQCFDLDEEVFRKIELPTTYYEHLHGNYFHIFQKNGSLALYGIFGGNSHNWTGYKLCLFVMEKDSTGQVQWKEKEYFYETEDHIDILDRPIGFSSSGRLIYWSWSRGRTIAATYLDDLSAVEELQLDTYNDIFSSVEELSSNFIENLDDLGVVEKLSSGSDSDSGGGESVKSSSIEVNVDTDFIESLTLFLE